MRRKLKAQLKQIHTIGNMILAQEMVLLMKWNSQQNSIQKFQSYLHIALNFQKNLQDYKKKTLAFKILV